MEFNISTSAVELGLVALQCLLLPIFYNYLVSELTDSKYRMNW